MTAGQLSGWRWGHNRAPDISRLTVQCLKSASTIHKYVINVSKDCVKLFTRGEWVRRVGRALLYRSTRERALHPLAAAYACLDAHHIW